MAPHVNATGFSHSYFKPRDPGSCTRILSFYQSRWRYSGLPLFLRKGKMTVLQSRAIKHTAWTAPTVNTTLMHIHLSGCSSLISVLCNYFSSKTGKYVSSSKCTCFCFHVALNIFVHVQFNLSLYCRFACNFREKSQCDLHLYLICLWSAEPCNLKASYW